MSEGVVIAGGGLAAQRCAETLRRLGYDGRIRMFCAEDHLPYDRPPLSKQVLHDGAAAASVGFRPAEWYETKEVDVIRGVAVSGLDAGAHTIELADGTAAAYEHLVVATGSVPRTLEAFDGYANVSTLRTVEDALALRELLERGARLVIIGAGFIGQEVASAARDAGVAVSMIEAEQWPLNALLGPEVGEWFAALHRREGVDLVLGETVAEVHGDERVGEVTLRGGRRLALDHVLVGIGVAPDLGWIDQEYLLDGAIRTDRCGRSGLADVYAAGDAAASHDSFLDRHALSGHWAAAGYQGSAVAHAIVGAPPPAAQIPSFWSDMYGIRIQYLGHAQLADTVSVEGDPQAGQFVATYTRHGVAVAGLAVGSPQALPALRERLTHMTQTRLPGNDTGE